MEKFIFIYSSNDEQTALYAMNSTIRRGKKEKEISPVEREIFQCENGSSNIRKMREGREIRNLRKLPSLKFVNSAQKEGSASLTNFSLPQGRQSGKAAFTLAEVLITIGIIGVVASITLPALIANYQEKQSISAFKKAYSELSQANQQLNAEYGGNWTYECENFNDRCFRDLFAKTMKTVKICDNSISDGCQFPSAFLDGTTIYRDININNDSFPAIITASGMSIKFRFHGNGCSSSIQPTCGWIQLDTNALKRPNKAAKDIFFLYLMPDGSFRSIGDQLQGSIGTGIYKDACNAGSGISCAAAYLLK